MLSIVGITLAIYLFLMLMGWGVSLLVMPSPLRQHQFWIAPWVGLIVTDISISWLSRIGLGTNNSIYIVCLIGFLALIICKYLKIHLAPTFKGIDIAFALSTLAGLVLALYPLITIDGIPTSISYGNNDPQLYALLGDFLKTHTIYQKPLVQADYPNSFLINQMLYLRPGAWLLYGAISSLLKLQTHETFTITLGVFFALTPSLIGVFTQLITTNYFSLILVLIISTLNINFLFFNYHGFGAQIPAQGCLILAFILLYLIDVNRLSKKYLISIALCISALGTLYAELIPFFVFPIILYFSLLLLRQNHGRLQLAKKIFKLLLYIFLTAILLDPLGIYEGFQWLVTVSSTQAGWSMFRWAVPADMLGFFSIYEPGNYPKYLPLIVSFPVCLIFFVGVLRLKKQEFWISLLFFTAVILIWLGLFRKFSYGYHKAVAFLNFFTIISFSIGLDSIFEILVKNHLARRKLIFIIRFVILGILSTLLLSAISPMFATMSSDRRLSVDSSLPQLADIPKDNRKIYIDINETSIWNAVWITKFLGDRPAAFLSPNIYYDGEKYVAKTIYPNSLFLTSATTDEFIKSVDRANSKIIWENGRYVLKETDFLDQAGVSLGENWHAAEPSWLDVAGSKQFHWLNQDATLEINQKFVDRAQIKLRVQFVPILPKTTVDLYLDGKLLQTVEVDAVGYYDFNIPLNDSRQTLKIHVREGTITPPNDPRDISIGVNSILVMRAN